MIQVPFTVTQGGWSYSDALYYDIVPDSATIEADAQVRFDQWLAVITAPQLSPDELSIEEQIATGVAAVLDSL
jgi:hypothetical protein